MVLKRAWEARAAPAFALLALTSACSSPLTGNADPPSEVSEEQPAKTIRIAGMLKDVDGDPLPEFPVGVLVDPTRDSEPSSFFFYMDLGYWAFTDPEFSSDEASLHEFEQLLRGIAGLEYAHTQTDERGRFTCELQVPGRVAIFAARTQADSAGWNGAFEHEAAGWLGEATHGAEIEELSLQLEGWEIPFDSELWRRSSRPSRQQLAPWLDSTRLRMMGDLVPMLRIGTTRSEILSLLGEPEISRESELLWWLYPGIPSDDAYLQLNFDEEDRLSEIDEYRD